MKTSIIRQRAADFFKRYSPFEAFSEQDLLELAGSGRVKFHESGEYVFRQGDAKAQVVWMIQQGRVEVLDERTSGEHLRDVLGPGDLLGLERFVGDGSCLYAVRTASDVILYGVNAGLFESFIPRYPAVKRFLSARLSVSGVLGFNRTSWLEADPPPMDFLKARLVALPVSTAMDEVASQVASTRNAIVALVDERGWPAGALTALTLCKARLDPAAPVPHSSLAVIGEPLTTRTAVKQMLRTRAEELAITADGTRESRLVAMLTASELELFCGHNPLRLSQSIRNADSLAEIVPLLGQADRTVMAALAQPSDVDDCCGLSSDMLASLAECCIDAAARQLAERNLHPPDIPYCWIMLGAAARGDLLNAALPAIAIVHGESTNNGVDASYFTELIRLSLSRLQSCGLTGSDLSWPEGAQPSMPLSKWKELYSDTIRDPIGNQLYAHRGFFDTRLLSGDDSLLRALHQHIQQELEDNITAISLLANDTLANLPPLTFFQGMVLELDGGERDSLDIARTVLAPIVDAARVFAIAHGRLVPSNTLERLAAVLPDSPEENAAFHEAADAFRVALYYQAAGGGPKIDPGKLGKFDQLLLKTSFSSIHRLLELTVATFIPAIA